MLANSGFTWNRLGFARMMARFPFAAWLFRLRLSPELLEQLNRLPSDAESGELYAAAVTRMRVGPSMKAVDLRRNSLTDASLIRLAREGKLSRICDVGVSDGSASLGLLEALPGAKIRLFDKFNFFIRSRRPLGAVLFNAVGQRLYRRVGPLLLYLYDWPSTSAPAPSDLRLWVKNPLLRRFSVEIEELDVFEEDLDEPFQIIKCCNCLNLEFYPPEKLVEGIRRLLSRLEEGGHLFIGQNHPRYEGGEAYFVLQRRGSGSALVEEKGGHDLLRWIRQNRPDLLGLHGA
jgi:hypothetical protein